ncbi:c-type cytochrome [Pseudomonas sp. gcc21]|nr:c-type cytochrome [Pseudomonas sp. gcc21]
MDDESIAERIKPYGEVCVAGDECAEAAAAAAPAPAAGGEAVADAGSAGGSEGEALFKSKPCGACHSVDNKLVGPALKEVGAKYAGQDDAVATLVASITQGSSGKWGAIPMPPNAVSEEEATTLAEWIISLN